MAALSVARGCTEVARLKLSASLSTVNTPSVTYRHCKLLNINYTQQNTKIFASRKQSKQACLPAYRAKANPEP